MGDARVGETSRVRCQRDRRSQTVSMPCWGGADRRPTDDLCGPPGSHRNGSPPRSPVVSTSLKKKPSSATTSRSTCDAPSRRTNRPPRHASPERLGARAKPPPQRRESAWRRPAKRTPTRGQPAEGRRRHPRGKPFPPTSTHRPLRRGSRPRPFPPNPRSSHPRFLARVTSTGITPHAAQPTAPLARRRTTSSLHRRSGLQRRSRGTAPRKSLRPVSPRAAATRGGERRVRGPPPAAFLETSAPLLPRLLPRGCRTNEATSPRRREPAGACASRGGI